jgi:hypothetical protein
MQNNYSDKLCGCLPQNLQVASYLQKLENELPLGSGSRLPYQAPVIEMIEVELEIGIANASARAIGRNNTMFDIEDYSNQGNTDISNNDIEIL